MGVGSEKEGNGWFRKFYFELFMKKFGSGIINVLYKETVSFKATRSSQENLMYQPT